MILKIFLVHQLLLMFQRDSVANKEREAVSMSIKRQVKGGSLVSCSFKIGILIRREGIYLYR